ncbi:MAG: peptide chain release factor N(5)-glutamine methyltransferase [Betaproteobacteria bacterium]|nr:peptide chain release factor N(5)-glutamine methyltransferase [Betaproteobacteria bacterium]
MNTKQALQYARTLDIDGLEAQTLLLHVLQRPVYERAWLLVNDTLVLTHEQQTRFTDGLKQLLDNMPIAYLTGVQAFHGLDLQVTPDVLVPRADTETLVDWALSLPLAHAHTTVLDLGTGSGAIALALKHKRPAWTVQAADHSAQALAVAQANAQRMQLEVVFTQSDWFSRVRGKFDLIVANPPYIAQGDPHLPALVHEPQAALVSGLQGLDDLQAIVDQAPFFLKPQGWLLLEHGHDQAAAVCDSLRQKGYTQVQSRNDLAGIARCSGGMRAEVK